MAMKSTLLARSPRVATFAAAPRVQALVTMLALLLVVGVGAYFRTLNLRDWDGGTGFHPDERYVQYTVAGLQLPTDWRDYFRTACPYPLPAPRNPGADTAKLEPSTASGCSTLNPRNFDWSRNFQYGSLPLTITRLASEVSDRTDAQQIVVTGRTLGALADTLTIVTVFLLGRLVFNRRVGVLAAAFYACAVMPIQQAHYFTSDSFAVCFGALALLFITRLAVHGGWANAIVSGVLIGAAAASKINMVVLAGLVPIAVGAWGVGGRTKEQTDPSLRAGLSAALRPLALLGVAGAATFVAFRVFQPDAFAGPNWWNIALDERFLATTREARLTASGDRDLPYLIQWAGRARWWYGWQNMVQWGMGVPLGIAAWLGWAVTGAYLIRRRHWALLVPWVWVLAYFGWIGAQLLMTMRYFLPLYPPLVVFAAWGVLQLGARDWERRTRERIPVVRIHRFILPPGYPLRAFILLFVLGTTLVWAWAYTRIYTRPYTRVAAAEWLQQQEPDGAVTTFEVWDDPLPLGGDARFKQIPTGPYGEEEPDKYLRTDADIDKAGLLQQLVQADYVVLTSPRVYGSVSRMPQRYPAITRYYRALFDGSLGFEQVATFPSFPSLGTVRIDDTAAEEAFWVYDHPRVTIFRRTDAFQVDRAYAIVAGDVAWDEVYRGLRPGQLNRAPSALLLGADAWAQWREAAAPMIPFGTLPSLLAWLLAIEVLGLAACGFLWRLRMPLPDRGLGVARVVGLAAFAVPPALLGAVGGSINRPLLAAWYALLVIVGGVLLWRERYAIRIFVAQRRRSVMFPQAIYGAVVVIGLALAFTNVGTVQPQTVARWSALARTPTLPPPDLFFASGHEALPYAAQLPFALLHHLLGIMPAVGLRLALSTGLALALAAVWSAVQSNARHGARSTWWIMVTVLLIALPGIVAADAPGWNPWVALGRGDIHMLSTVLIVAAVVALARGTARAHPLAALVLLPPLVLLRGDGVLAATVVSTVITGVVWWRSRRCARRVLAHGAVAATALALGSVWAWSIAPFAANDGSVLRAVVGIGLSVFMPLLVLAAGALLGLRAPHAAIVHTLALGALVLLGSALVILADLVRGDAAQLVTVASVLLIAAAGQTLPRLRLAQPRLHPATLAVIALLGLGVLLSTTFRVRAEAQVAVSPNIDVIEAAAAIDPNATASVLVAAPHAAADWSAATGMQALIAAPERERRLRAWLAPAVDGVIDRRVAAIETIYGADADAARRTLDTYHIEYVAYGSTERSVFPAAGATLDALVEQNVLGRVYDHNGTALYQHTPPTGTPPFVAQPIHLQPRTTQASMLPQPVGTLPAVDEYAWNTWANNSFVALGLWLVVIELAGLLAFPVVRRVFRRWHDHGWAFSKLVGLLLWGYFVWLPVSLGWWNFTRWSLLWGALALGMLNLGFWLVDRRRTRNSRTRRPGVGHSSPITHHASLIRSELWFLGAFAAWALVRAANPDVWHPIYGGEKPFEFGFLNAILRSPVLPPYDPFFSDGVINYYYYGLFLMALPIKATGIAPAVGFNLALALLFALATTVIVALGREIGGRWRWGVLAAVFLAGMGPFASVLRVGEGRGIDAVQHALNGGLVGFGERLGAWFWGPSRVIAPPTSSYYTITEFPLFAFLFADLHPHLIALPVTLLAVACAWELARRRPTPSLLLLGALALGTLAAANSWDAPTYALVIGGALVGRTWQRARGRVPLRRMIAQLGVAALLAVAMLAGGIALYWPFFSQYHAQVGGIGFVQRGDSVAEWAWWFGPLLFVVVSLVGMVVWQAALRSPRRWRVAARMVALSVPLLPLVLLLSGFVLPGADDGWSLRVMLGMIGGVGAGVALGLPMALRRWFPLWIATVGVLVSLGVEIVFVRDHLAGGSAQRMNTVFKFGFQIWTLWALAAATAIPLIARALRRHETIFGVWLGIVGCLLLPGLVYPLAGIPSRLATRFDVAQPLTLDGLAFMDRAEYRYQIDDNTEPATISLQPDAEAIRWLNENISGTPVLLTSDREFYRAYGMRIAANTGLPTVLGRLHQDEQRDPQLVGEREQDVATLWNTTDLAETQQLLRRYRVDYVYVGPIERVLYAPDGIAKWQQLEDTLLDVAYQNAGVTIYRVDRAALAEITPEALPALPAIDTETAALEAAWTAAPDNSSAAFALGRHYLDRDQAADAVRVLEAAARAHPDDVPLQHLYGDALLRAGRPDDAVAAWQHAVDVDRSPNNLTKLGRELLAMDRFEDAERMLNEALALDPAFGEAMWALGEVYRVRDASGDRERALAQYQQCLERLPADSPWRAEAATSLEALGAPIN